MSIEVIPKQYEKTSIPILVILEENFTDVNLFADINAKLPIVVKEEHPERSIDVIFGLLLNALSATATTV
jgi:hypothetical protein